MPGSPDPIGVLILNHNGWRWLPSLYESIRTNGYPEVRIYLVDNASQDESVSMTLQNYPEVKVIRMPHNLGYSVAYNLAMPYAFADGCQWVVWSNNDVILEPGCLAELMGAVQSDPNVGIAGPAFLAWDGNQPNGYMTGNHPGTIEAMQKRSSLLFDVEWVEGSFLLVSRRCVEAVGPLDPLLFLFWEEADFCRRAGYQGYRVVLVPRALARHYGSGTTREKELAPTTAWLRSRNYYIYQLADPRQSFARNLLNALHLLGVNVKAGLPGGLSRLFLEIRVFADILGRLSQVYVKWHSDRAGRPPAIASEGPEPIRVEVLHAGG